MATSRIKAGKIQAPPPEEAEQVKPIGNPILSMARRLCLANLREKSLRSMRVEAMEHAVAHDIKQLKPLWQTLARKLMTNGIDNPERFIHAQYQYAIASHATLAQAPSSGMFVSDEAMKRFRRYDGRADIYLAQELQSAIRNFDCAIIESHLSFPKKTDPQLWEYVLSNQLYTFSPLFRYALGASGQLIEVMRAYHDEALLQLLSDPQGYISSWGEVVPENLKAEAAATLQADL